ncbi:MAG: hemolysin family protein [Paracoccus sp. (in: a-proteobacteria)]|nr:hemolysin family protein [Paracoccus sp. (in: a-proteobacteria)]
MGLEIAIIIALTLINGSLAMAELALVSARPMRLRQMAEGGARGAATALRLMERPGRVLSTVQIGITLVGVLNGAFSGATIGQRLGETLEGAGLAPALAGPVGIGLVVAAITALSILIGELVPKQIALSNPEAISARMAPGVALVAALAAPVVWLIDNSASALLRLLGVGEKAKDAITEEELRLTLAEAMRAGVIGSHEKEIMQGVMRVADLRARGLMTPLDRLDMIDLSQTPAQIIQTARNARVTRLPAHEGDPLQIAGVVALRDMVADPDGRAPDVKTLLQPAPFISETAGAAVVLEALRATPVRMVLVRDADAKGVVGAITTMDFLSALAGGFTDFGDLAPGIQPRQSGGWLVAGRVSPADLRQVSGFPATSAPTMEALVLDLAGGLPATGDVLRHDGWVLEIADLDGLQIDKLIVTPPAEKDHAA